MADAIKVAEARREEYKKDIAKKEAEIEELKELISDLDSFIEFGEALVSDGPADTKPDPKPETAAAAPAADAKPAEASQPQQPRVVKSRPTNGDWENDGESGIARVLAARNA